MAASLKHTSVMYQANTAPLPEEPPDSDLEVSEEDVHFVDEYSQRLGFLTALNRAQIDRRAELPACTAELLHASRRHFRAIMVASSPAHGDWPAASACLC